MALLLVIKRLVAIALVCVFLMSVKQRCQEPLISETKVSGTFNLGLWVFLE